MVLDGSEEPSTLKRPRKDFETGADTSPASNNGQAKGSDDTSSEDDIGPALPSSAPLKKRRKLPYEKLYINALPSSQRYSKSLMHKDQLSFLTITPYTDFLITSSIDGVVKFWKKVAVGIEAVKEFKAHLGEIRSVSVSQDGRSYATAGADKTIKIFDVITFDLLAIIQLPSVPRSICYVHRRGASIPLLAVSEDIGHAISIYDGRGETQSPLHTISSLHRSTVTAMAYNNEHGCTISVDESGMVEYWSPETAYEKPKNVWEYKSSTDLFAFKKAKSAPASVVMSPDGATFAIFSFPDRQVRIFDFTSGKLLRSYDESIATITDMQQAGTSLQKLDDVEFGRRLAVEREIENPAVRNKINVIFDESSNFIMYGSIMGVKVVNTFTNRVVKVYGKDEPFRSLNLALYQGQPQKKGVVTVSMAASANPLLQEAEERDPMLVTTGSGKVRFYIFTNEEEITKSTRDVQNEKPKHLNARNQLEAKPAESGSAAIIHTTYGDIHIRLFPEAAPKAVENFVTHSKNGYYNATKFHRIIKKFMIQCGDPLGDGTGGESIWGKEFEDEFSTLKHDKPYTVSMANAGPNTNGSQFFITTEKTPWLDNKHTIFGRAVQGLDVVHRIENTRVYKEKPEEDIKIVNIDIL
ncbi:Peptidyl-prolyl cis-trans isomerase cyp15 [Xanthoria calcicola]